MPYRTKVRVSIVATVVCALLLLFGLDRVSFVVTTGLVLVFLAFFVRHAAFATAALQWAEDDLRSLREPPLLLNPPSVSVLVAAHNEALVIENTVAALDAIEYPGEVEFIIIDDKSSDGTGDLVDAAIAGNPKFRLVRRTDGGGGKSGALNAAVQLARGDVLVVFDADHQPFPDVLSRLARHFSDPAVALVQGRCIIRNHAESRLARAIAVDYLSGYLVNEYGRQAVYELPAYGGANCAVRKSALVEIGGWNESSVTEDTDLTVRLVLSGYKTRYDVTARDREEAVGSVDRYVSQRFRWARGHQQCWRDYWRATLSSPYLSWPEKVETLMFLSSFHTPVLCGFGLLMSALTLSGVIEPGVSVLPLTTLMFVGPVLELAGGLILARARSRSVLSLVWFIPTFMLSIYVCSRAWLSSFSSAEYTWVKTARSGS